MHLMHFNVFNAFYRELLLRVIRMVIPSILRDRVLNITNEGHQGLAKTKATLRSKVWWPKMDSDVEKLCKTCHGCQLVGEFWRPRVNNVTCCASYCSLERYQCGPVRDIAYFSGRGLFQQILGGNRLEVHNECKDS